MVPISKVTMVGWRYQVDEVFWLGGSTIWHRGFGTRRAPKCFTGIAIGIFGKGVIDIGVTIGRYL